MSGVNTHQNDPLSIGVYQSAEPKCPCGFCNVQVPDSTLTEIDGYKLCIDCYEDYVNTPDEVND